MQEDFARLQTTVQDLEERNKTVKIIILFIFFIILGHKHNLVLLIWIDDMINCVSSIKLYVNFIQIAQSRDEAEQIRSKLAAALGQKTVQLENLERSCKELEDKLKASSLMEVGEKKAIREEFKAVESSLKEEIEELRRKVC